MNESVGKKVVKSIEMQRKHMKRTELDLHPDPRQNNDTRDPAKQKVVIQPLALAGTGVRNTQIETQNLTKNDDLREIDELRATVMHSQGRK